MTNLRIPGPTPMPPSVQEAAGRPMINHRGLEFMAMMRQMVSGLQWAFQTENEIIPLTASGTGGLEAAIVNLLSPGDRVLALAAGVFGERFASLAEAYGAAVTRLTFPYGQPLDISEAKKALAAAAGADKPYKMVLATHNETSTGITNDIAALASTLQEYPEASRPLIAIDAVSSMGAIDLPVDQLKLDVVVTGSQKMWAAPPGMAFISVSSRAWQAMETAHLPRFYFDLRKAREVIGKGQTPWTPAVSIVYAMNAALELMQEEGLERVHARHARVAEFTRDGLEALGLTLFAQEGYRSNVVTAVNPPSGVDPDKLRARLRDQYQIDLAGGQGKMKGKIFRIGHLGFVTESDIAPVLEALKKSV